MPTRLVQPQADIAAVVSTLGLPVPMRCHSPIQSGGPQVSRYLPVLPLSQRRLMLRGDRDFLRALRAAEMAEWEASGGDFAQSTTETQPVGGGFAGSKVTLAAAAADNPSHDLHV